MFLTIFVLLATFLISLLGTRLTIIALQRNPLMNDRPDFRKPTQWPAPRGGGVALIIAFIIGGMALDQIDYLLLLALLLLTAIGLLDDLIRIDRWVIVLVQAAAILLIISFAPPLFAQSGIGIWLERAITTGLWLVIMQAFSDQRSMDGLPSISLIFIGLGAAISLVWIGQYPSQIALLSMLLVMNGLAFIWWNWPPAKIRLGSVGLIPLGFILGYLFWLLTIEGYGLIALILPAYMITEYIATKWQHIRGNRAPYFFQRALQSGFSKPVVATHIMGLHMLLILLASQTLLTPEILYYGVGGAYLISGILIGFYAAGQHRDRAS